MFGFLRRLVGVVKGQVSEYEDGYCSCDRCGAKLLLSEYSSLALQSCSSCGGMNFIPRNVGGFWLIEPLGGGGMGSVYKAAHIDYSSELFAVKVLPEGKSRDETCRDNLLREIRIMKTIGYHQAIASVVSSGTEEDDLFLATRFIAGERLDQRIGRLGQISEQESILIALRLLSAVSHVYENGYLYRDMKPQNVIIGETGAHLIDFGICQRIEDAVNSPGVDIQGSALYYPPERVTGTGERANSEIYSLGMVLYHVLTGAPYFTAKDIETMTTLNVRRNRLKRQSEPERRLKPDIVRIIEKMICRDQKDRYQGFVEVERDFMQALLRRAEDEE